jgi:hypothetical protein
MITEEKKHVSCIIIFIYTREEKKGLLKPVYMREMNESHKKRRESTFLEINFWGLRAKMVDTVSMAFAKIIRSGSGRCLLSLLMML